MDKKLAIRTKKILQMNKKYKDQMNRVSMYAEQFCISCECVKRDRTKFPCRNCLLKPINRKTGKPAFYKSSREN